MAWGKQRCGCWSEPGAHWDTAEPRVGALDTASMRQGDTLRVQVRGKACKGGIQERLHGEGGSKRGAQSRIGYAVRLGRAAFGRRGSRGGNGLSLGIQSHFPVKLDGQSQKHGVEGAFVLGGLSR